jgi:hypothetical protein
MGNLSPMNDLHWDVLFRKYTRLRASGWGHREASEEAQRQVSIECSECPWDAGCEGVDGHEDLDGGYSKWIHRGGDAPVYTSAPPPGCPRVRAEMLRERCG